MRKVRAIEMLVHLPRRASRELIGLYDVIRLVFANHFSRSSVVALGGPVVSLTTHGQRGRTVYISIESIARGELRPSRLILWIDESQFLNNPPLSIQRLQKRGLEVRVCENYLAHKKYYPFVASQDSFSFPLVTADDDILYPRYWLKELAKAQAQYPDSVNCYFAGKVVVDSVSGKMRMDGQSCYSIEPSYCHHPIGLAGIIHPPSFLAVLKKVGLEFQNYCPRNCDVWFHVQALRSGFTFRQIVERPPYFAFQSIPGSQKSAMAGRGIDQAVADTYKESDLQLLSCQCKGVKTRDSFNSEFSTQMPQVQDR